MAALLLACVAGASPAAAQDGTSAIPYAALYGALSPALQVREGSGVVAIKLIESKLGIPATDIRVTIHARAGDIALVPQRDGAIDFPLDDALKAENPEVTTNQPRGTLTLSVTLALAPPAGPRVPAATLLAGVAQIEQALRANGEAGVSIDRVEVRFPPQANATVTMHGGSNRFLMADEHGRVVLTRADDLAGDDTEIEFSQRPLLLLPQR